MGIGNMHALVGQPETYRRSRRGVNHADQGMNPVPVRCVGDGGPSRLAGVVYSFLAYGLKFHPPPCTLPPFQIPRQRRGRPSAMKALYLLRRYEERIKEGEVRMGVPLPEGVSLG